MKVELVGGPRDGESAYTVEDGQAMVKIAAHRDLPEMGNAIYQVDARERKAHFVRIDKAD